MDYKVKVRRQNRRNLLMQVVTGGVDVYIPLWMKPDHPQVQAFIEDGLRKLQDQIPPPRPEQTSPEAIREQVNLWAERMGLQPQRITLRAMRRKWGSCSSKGSVTLNAVLCTLPPDLVEYVIVHELAHLKVFHHGPAFWALVAEYIPDYAQRRDALNRYMT
jgi:predicted metal-dependent hydrolase